MIKRLPVWKIIYLRLQVNFRYGWLLRFLNSANGTKWSKASQQPWKRTIWFHFTIMLPFNSMLCFIFCNSSVVRQKGDSQNGCYKKTKPTKFSETQISLTPWYAHIPRGGGGKKYLFFRKFGTLCFLLTPFFTPEFQKFFTAWKVSKQGVFSDLYFSVFGVNTVCIRETNNVPTTRKINNWFAEHINRLGSGFCITETLTVNGLKRERVAWNVIKYIANLWNGCSGVDL